MVVKGTCGTEYGIECVIDYDDDFYVVEIDGFPYRKNQPVFGLGFYEEKALKDALKKVKNKEIRKEIKKQFGI